MLSKINPSIVLKGCEGLINQSTQPLSPPIVKISHGHTHNEREKSVRSPYWEYLTSLMVTLSIQRPPSPSNRRTFYTVYTYILFSLSQVRFPFQNFALNYFLFRILLLFLFSDVYQFFFNTNFVLLFLQWPITASPLKIVIPNKFLDVFSLIFRTRSNSN